MSDILRLLHVEDSVSDAALTERSLTKAGYEVFSERVANAREMKAALAGRSWDLIIADYRLPEFDAPAALTLLQETGFDIPFIVVSGAIGEELAVAIMRSGAKDYVIKDNLARLAPAVEREIREVRTRRERTQAEKALGESGERLVAQAAAMEQQAEVLRQRETMLREIHHRVKNNMQVMSSLLSLQSRLASHSETRRMLEENQNRIQTMALLHEILYQSQDLALVDFSKYLLRMVDCLFRSYGVNSRQITLHTELDAVGLELDDALPTGLLISEVITNSLKHGFPEGRRGEVRIVMRLHSATTVSLVLSDTGVGLPADVDWATSRSLGLRLVRALAEQLHAALDIRSEGGTEVQLLFNIISRSKGADVLQKAGGGGKHSEGAARMV